ncbi:hypothetical protein [Sulfuricurvum sp.]|uniref:hypothetical protein n=1 Tax=Sulfuricurvum sp. TaxID=2025608 RepID=UPI003C510C1D
MKKSLYIGMFIVSVSILANEVKTVAAKQKEQKLMLHAQQWDKGVHKKTVTTVHQPMKKKEYPRGTISTH